MDCPGELAHVQLDVAVPEDPSSIGDYSFNVTLSGAWTQRTVEALLNVVQNPILLDLQPGENNTIVGSTDLLISWRTTTNSSSEVYVKNVNDSAFTLVTGDWGKEHFVCVHNLTRNNDYVWYVRSAAIHGEVSSELRTLHVSNGISFTQSAYTFNIERDYAQHASISVVNTDTQSHDLLLQTLNPYEDFIVGFVGAGSIDQNATLRPNETRSVDLYMHAQDAEQENYTFTIQLTNIGPENISDYAGIRVNVRWPNINLSLVELSSDPWTLSKTLRVINNGDPITDLQIYGSDELLGEVLFRPTIWHAYLGSGESLTFDVVPVLTSDFTSYHGFVLAEGAGTIIASLQVDFALPPNKNVFRVEAPQMTIEFCQYYDTDESPNTNPQSDRPVESYVVNNTLVFFGQVIVDVCQNGAPVSGANVSLTVWNETISSTQSSCTLFAGKAKFEFAGGIGTYHYKAVLLDYGASTEERTFSVSTSPLFQIEPNQITWLEISDGNSTFGDITENTTVVMDKGPYTFKATQNGIGENMTFNLCLTWEYDAYKKIHVPGQSKVINWFFRLKPFLWGTTPHLFCHILLE